MKRVVFSLFAFPVYDEHDNIKAQYLLLYSDLIIKCVVLFFRKFS